MTLTAASLTVLFATLTANAQSSSAPPGDNGDVKVHDSSTAVTDEANNPHVCQFYLDGFNFDPNQSVTWHIDAWSPTGNHTTQVLSGTLMMDANGHGFTTDYGLPNGHYKLFWNFVPENGKAKQKVFWVSCPVTPPTSPPPTSPPPTTMPPTSPPTTQPSCGCTSTPTATPTTPGSSGTSDAPGTPASQGTPSAVPTAPAPTPVTGSLPVTG